MHRIPAELSIDLHGNVAHQAGAAGTVSHLHGSHRLTSRYDGLQPVQVLLGGLVQLDPIGIRQGFQEHGVAGIQGFQLRPGLTRIGRGDRHIAAAHEDPSFMAVKLHPVGEGAADLHRHPVGIAGVNHEIAMHIPETGGGKGCLGFHLHRTGIFGVHGPVGGIQVVGAPAGDHPGPELFAAEPARAGEVVLRVHPFLGIVDHGRGAEPVIVIQVCRHRHGRLFVPRGIPREPDLDLFQLPYAAVSHELAGPVELGPGGGAPLLAPLLEDAPGPVHRVAHLAPLADGQRGRFLKVDVLAGQGRVHGGPGMPMVGGGDDHRIDAWIGQHFPVILVHGHVAVTGLPLVRIKFLDPLLAQAGPF